MTLQDQAFRALTPKQQSVWELVMQNFYTQAKAAKKLHISREAVKDRLNKAKKRFTQFVQENME